ncbi:MULTISPECIES: aspartate dehydrogenase [unclassified Sulfitobacter]|uniref:aspartate dehydrogenase n=1 Tax=unclassified Sulfitobacter TaxID=196795 RepID=UPI0007C279C9|nr:MULTISPECIES: aspartate dehydrogenase [unclassified Sulfitobacter]KZX96890.1 aspartate dehydrogenase [Sulfitobacter sp. HI0023]KZY25286.1 aspartate dehydrogenase [Sulfitobacter sp. HI0040]KZZ69451.1 aspartate dehydrogenase [Sulfitobacter sp. HI0129]
MHLGLVGYGNIGAALLALLTPQDAARVTMLVRPGRAVDAPGVDTVETVEDLIAARPDLLVECAGHEAVRDVAVPALEAGIDVVVVSVGALSDAGLEDAVRQAAEKGGARVILPPGAIGGIDLLAAAAAAGDLEVTYTGTKPPAAWRGTPAEDKLDLDALREAAVIYAGTAREVAQAFPKNANVAATLGLAGAGLDATRAELVADPAADGNRHAYRVRSALGSFEVRIDNKASAGNAKTSAATIYSALREIRNRKGPMVI